MGIRTSYFDYGVERLKGYMSLSPCVWIVSNLICSQQLNIHLMIIVTPHILRWLALAMGWYVFTIFVWVSLFGTPSIRKYVVLPNPSVTHGAYIKCFEFGFDSRNNDFKVVRLVSHLDRPSSPEVEVYSFATQCWKSFTGSRAPLFILKKLVFARTNQMSRNGVLHWAVMRNKPHENFIMTFDLVEETFGEMMLPQSLRAKNIMVSVLGGGERPTVIHSSSLPSFPSLRVEEYFNLWVMNEYGFVESWTKVYTGIANSLSRPLGFRKSGDVLLHSHSTGEIIAVDEENELEKNLRIKGHDHASLSYHVESLFLLDQSTDDVISY